MPVIKRAEIAGRIRGLIAGQDTSFRAAALRLGVDEVALRISLDDLSPYPTVDVIAAVVRAYGVDPHWLLTGEYDASTHRTSIETSTGELPAVLNALIDRVTPIRGSAAIPSSDARPT